MGATRDKRMRPETLADLLPEPGARVYKNRLLGATIEEMRYRFKRLIRKDAKGCWIWQACTNSKPDNYGVASCGKGKPFMAHRVSYVLFVGDIPPKQLVLHECDVPNCTNPAHLFLGDDGANVRDAVKKGRAAAVGERNPNARLTMADAVEIRKAANSGVPHKQIAAQFGVSFWYVGDIARNRYWKHGS